MRFDLLHEHDRFIPGWHCRSDPVRMRAQNTPPEWSLVPRLVKLIRRSLRNILLISAESHPIAFQSVRQRLTHVLHTLRTRAPALASPGHLKNTMLGE